MANGEEKTGGAPEAQGALEGMPEAAPSPDEAAGTQKVEAAAAQAERAGQREDLARQVEAGQLEQAAGTTAETPGGQPAEAHGATSAGALATGGETQAPPEEKGEFATFFETVKKEKGLVAAVLATVTYAGGKFWGWLKGLFGKKKEGGAEGATTDAAEQPSGKFDEQLLELLKEFGLTDSGDPKKNYFDVAVKLAKEVQEKYGIPYQVVVAQTCLESGFGRSGLSQKNFNCFGIKAMGGYTGPQATWKTKEEVGGQEVSIDSNFRAYSSIRESFMDYGKLLKENPRYQKAFDFIQNPKAFLQEVIQAGYATDSNYVAKAEKAASDYGLSLA